MTREIKFKYPWEGKLYPVCGIAWKPDGSMDVSILLAPHHTMKIQWADPDHLMQYIGRKDKVRQEIYNGSCVEVSATHTDGHVVKMYGVVKKDDNAYFGVGGWIIESLDESWKEEHDGEPGVLPFDNCKIIGHFLANPELLEKD